jgi:putative transcriptional regulator
MSRHLDTVQNEVRGLRVGRDLSQADLATALGVSRQTVNAIEVGKYSPSLPLAIKLARFFERAVEEVFHVDDDA